MTERKDRIIFGNSRRFPAYEIPIPAPQPHRTTTLKNYVGRNFPILAGIFQVHVHISRGLRILRDKVLARSWFTPVVLSPEWNNNSKGTEGRESKGYRGRSSIYSSDSDEEDGGGIPIQRKQSQLKRTLPYIRSLEEKRRQNGTYGCYGQDQQKQSRMAPTFSNSLNVTKVALISRVILLVLQIIVTNLYGFAKHENDGFKFTPEDEYGSKADNIVNATIGGFANWDGQYFLHLAVHGYTHENTLAFFPLFPAILFFISKTLHMFFFSVISLSSIVLFVGWIFNTVCFLKTADVLYRIAQHVNPELAYITVLLFCFNPASIFFSSLYTESLFAFLTVKVILSLYERKIVASMVFASLSTICRSNGLLNFGFIVSYLMEESFKTTRGNLCRALVDLIRQCSVIILFLIPFLQFQAFAIWRFCQGSDIKLSPYCKLEMLPYTYIQQKNWNVGFMKYFEVKQIPNFLLALPVLFFLSKESGKRFVHLLARSLRIRFPSEFFSMYIAFHGLFLALFCLLNVHVQVSTRLILSAFPYFYIYMAESCLDEKTRYRNSLIDWPIQSTGLNLWCLTYFIIGGILFPLGYPWT